MLENSESSPIPFLPCYFFIYGVDCRWNLLCLDEVDMQKEYVWEDFRVGIVGKVGQA